MFATPIIPGQLYHVKGGGLDVAIEAAHPCDALIAATYLLEVM
jgi:hypothetical protein